VKRRLAAGEMVGDVMRREPRTIQVFLKHGMACVGCAIAPYHTIAEASAEYGLRLDAFLQELAAVGDAS
jgi:hybrid cluster-associated redox disulfide protein